MNYNILFTSALLILLTFFSVYEIIQIYKVENFIFSSESNIQNTSDTCKIVVVVPIFKEKSIIINSIKWMNNLKFPNCKKYIYYVGSKAETGKETTVKMGLTYASNNHFNINFIETPRNVLGKAKQINYAIDFISNRFAPSNHLYYCFFDADSRPDLKTLYAFENAIKKYDFPIALQEPSLYTKNNESISTYARWESVYQQKRVFLNEINNQLRSQYNDYVYTYMVGHGMCLRSDFLIKTYKFSSPFDDVPMGQRLRMMGIPIIPIKKFDYADTSISFREIFRQSGGWFLGGIVYRELKRMNLKRIKSPFLTRIVTVVNGTIDMLSWYFYGIVILFSLYLSMHSIIVFCLLIVWITLQAVVLYNTDQLSNKIEKSSNRFQHYRLKPIEYWMAALIRPIIRASAIFSCIDIWKDHGIIRKAKRVEDDEF